MKPFVKWAGGKRQILQYINKFIENSHYEDSNDFTYIEPFLGGGAVFFSLNHKKAIINDLNSDLINAYKVIKSEKYLELIEQLKVMNIAYNEDKDEYYYATRALDREPEWPNNLNEVERAARMIFLNKTCYNGLYRVNNKGQFNTPIGRYANPLICDEKNIIQVHNFLSDNDIQIENKSYEEIIDMAKENDIIYLDPPYDYEDDDGFTKYQMNGFTFDDFKLLKEKCDKALLRGAYVIISNNATQKVLQLFDDSKYRVFYDNNRLDTKRLINCKGTNRYSGKEVIFWGIPCTFPQANSLEKVISLIMAPNEVLNDKDMAKSVIEVTTDRQVSYYYSSLSYLGLLTSNKKWKQDILDIKDNEEKVKIYIFNTLMKMDFFKNLYQTFLTGSIDKKYINEEVKKINSRLNEDTIERRASTVKAWLEWMYKQPVNCIININD